MSTRELAKIDLNLLISLQVMLEESNVSRAAERLFITQPAMSKTLSRLRELFDDPLFTRSSHGMQPTPRALELSTELNDILGGIRRLVSGTSFEPASFTGEVTIALSEYIGLTLVPALVARLQDSAPQLSLRIVTRVENQLEQLAQGNLDFAIHIEQSHYGKDFRIEHLGGGHPAILARESHPLHEGKINWQRLGEYPIIRLYVADWDQLAIEKDSDILRLLRDHSRGSLEISHLLTALEVLRDSDYYMLGPAYLLHNVTATRGIRAIGLPTGRDYSVNYVLAAHHRTAHSPLHDWLWGQITCTIRELNTAQPRKLRQRIRAGGRTVRRTERSTGDTDTSSG